MKNVRTIEHDDTKILIEEDAKTHSSCHKSWMPWKQSYSSNTHILAQIAADNLIISWQINNNN